MLSTWSQIELHGHYLSQSYSYNYGHLIDMYPMHIHIGGIGTRVLCFGSGCKSNCLMMHLALEICQCSHAGSLTANNLQHRCRAQPGTGQSRLKSQHQLCLCLSLSFGFGFRLPRACGGIMALWPIKVKVDIKC